MLALLKDAFAAASLKARYSRLARERVLRLLESRAEFEGHADGRWDAIGGGTRSLDSLAKADLRTQARQLVIENPHARNVLRLMEAYVVGPDCRVSAMVEASDHEAASTADRLWRRFLAANCRHFSYREFARRTWRDGECFVRHFPRAQWPPVVRFLDPETIGSTPEAPESSGVITDLDDAETVVAYLLIDQATGELREAIPAGEVLHAKINADSNEPRGTTLFAPLIAPLTQYERWLDTELVARKLQASIVLWRKVSDGPTASFGSTADDDLAIEAASRERFHAGSILTTSASTDLQFLQPPSHIRDSAPLGRMMLLSAAAGAGLPEYMLTGDASNANYASTMIAEGPAVKLFQSEQKFFAVELSRLWRWVMAEAVRLGQLPAGFLDSAEPDWAFPTLVARDRPRERYADVRLVQAGILSRSEIARRENVDPSMMRAELAAEKAKPKDDAAS
ncbi:MAG: phage portal protein [Planctomycetaceae bacterium]|nr:phage portal protein [Planctomycetaceae bacterium]